MSDPTGRLIEKAVGVNGGIDTADPALFARTTAKVSGHPTVNQMDAVGVYGSHAVEQLDFVVYGRADWQALRRVGPAGPTIRRLPVA